MVKGFLNFYSETGTEGGWYTVQDASFIHYEGEPCWNGDDPWCPTRHPELFAESGMRPQHSSYDGMISLDNGDKLTIFDVDGETVLWSGIVNLRRVDSYGPEGGTLGLRVHQHADMEGVDDNKWLTWFIADLPCELEKA